MFKYLWIIMLVLVDLFWMVAGIKEIIDDYVDGETLFDIIGNLFSGFYMILPLWLFINGLTLTVASLISFCISAE